jgi:putative ABC transport system permease protein
MRLGGHFREAAAALRLNALRSALTAIGVIIGVAGVIGLGAANDGAAKRLEEQIAVHGAYTLTAYVFPQQLGRVVRLTDKDASAIEEQAPGIDGMSREIWGNVSLVAGNQHYTTQFWAVDAAYAHVFDVKMSEGRFFDDSEVRSGAKVVVLGPTVAQKLFGDELPIDQILRVSGVPMRVIGVRKKLGASDGRDNDDYVVVPITTARSRLPIARRATAYQLDTVYLRMREGADRNAAKKAILAVLHERKRMRDGGPERFGVEDNRQAVEAMTATQATMSWLLAATAAISLVVGGVGIMNIMLVSVTERTHEIGLRMAIGARKRDILMQFLIEAVVLCIAGGTLGLALGVIGAYVVAQSAGWPLVLGLETIAVAILASAGVGIVFGYIPAHRAAALNPIDALRRE